MLVLRGKKTVLSVNTNLTFGRQTSTANDGSTENQVSVITKNGLTDSGHYKLRKVTETLPKGSTGLIGTLRVEDGDVQFGKLRG